jgi:hypothetical protein
MANHDTTHPSRRAAMTVLASAAALGTTVAAASPDGELLELRHQFHSLLPGELTARAEVERLGELCDARLAELFPAPDDRRLAGRLTKDECAKYDAASEVVRAETGRTQASRLWNQRHEALERVAMAIKEAPVATLAGLLAKAEAMVWLASSCFARSDMPIDWSAYEASPLDLVEAMFAVAGEPLPGFIAEEIERWAVVEEDEA